MGYTHYFELKKPITTEALEDAKKISKKYNHLIQYEYDNSKEPSFNKRNIRFNGIKDDGHETFLIRNGHRDFCKTARKPYDIVCCEILLIFKHHYGEHFDVSSDGFWVSKDAFDKKELDGVWNEALHNVKEEFGYEFELIPEISKSGNYEYYQFHIEKAPSFIQ